MNNLMSERVKGNIQLYFCTTAYVDFYPVDSATITFPPNISQMDYNFSLVDNMIVEDTEIFSVSLSVVTMSGGVELGTHSAANITILDNDKVTVQFGVLSVTYDVCDVENLLVSAFQGTVKESRGSLTVNLVKTGLSDIPVTVLVKSEDRTATGEM